MEHIRQAVERARTAVVPGVEQASPPNPQWQPPQAPGRADGSVVSRIPDIELNPVYLESKRVVAHDISDPRSRSFDMLRTQVLQSMDRKDCRLLALTSPSPGCGKTLTSVNLALSMARQSDRSVLLVDLDIHKPQVATSLGISDDYGLLSVLEGRTKLSDVLVPVRSGNSRLHVLPCEKPDSIRSDWMGSPQMVRLMQELRRGPKSQIVIFDMPPVLAGDDVISILPQIDCMLLVAAVGVSTVSQIKECNKHLQAATVLRIVLNKVTEPVNVYY